MFLKQVAEGNGHAKLELVAKLGAGYQIIWGKMRSYAVSPNFKLFDANLAPQQGPTVTISSHLNLVPKSVNKHA